MGKVSKRQGSDSTVSGENGADGGALLGSGGGGSLVNMHSSSSSSSNVLVLPEEIAVGGSDSNSDHESLLTLAKPPCGLREQLLFRSSSSNGGTSTEWAWFYHGCVVVNLFLRLVGALLGLSDIPSLARLRGIDLSLVLQALEVGRRCLWAVLRVEWEVIKTAKDFHERTGGTPVARGPFVI
jgi:hypothetical protein